MGSTNKRLSATGQSANFKRASKQAARHPECDITDHQGAAPVQKALWVLVVLCWPLASKIFVVDVLFQLLRALFCWNAADVHAGWTFILHLGMLSGLTYFVAFGDPDRVQ